MEQVEAAVGEDHGLSREAAAVNLGEQMVPVEDLRVLGMMVVDQVAKDFLSIQERDPELFDLEAARDVSQLGGFVVVGSARRCTGRRPRAPCRRRR